MERSFRRRTGTLAALILFASAGLAAANASAVRSAIVMVGKAITKCDNATNCAEWYNAGSGAGLVGKGMAGPGLVGNSSATDKTIAAVLGNGLGAGRGVDGESTSAEAVFGESTSYYGVRGVTDNSRPNIADAGVEGLDGSTDEASINAGVIGITVNSGVGVFGNSKTTSDQSSAAGVAGVSHPTAVSSAADNAALSGISLGGDGLYAFSASGGGAYFENNVSSIGTLDIHADASNGFPLVSENETTHTHVDFDSQGDVLASGVFQGGGPYEVTHRTSDGGHVQTYGTESAEATVEDVGTGQLVGGRAVVTLEPRFAATIDGRTYHVFLTPLGDTRGLYVRSKSPRAFEVSETQGGRGTLAFDYRLVARPGDARTARLPVPANALANLTRRPLTASHALRVLRDSEAMEGRPPQSNRGRNAGHY